MEMILKCRQEGRVAGVSGEELALLNDSDSTGLLFHALPLSFFRHSVINRTISGLIPCKKGEWA